MDPELEAYDRTWQTTPKDERNALCQQLADDYVAAHPDLQSKYGALTIPELVALVDLAREAGNDERRVELEIWINYRFEYQQIGGYVAPAGVVREHAPINVAGDIRAGGAA